MNEEEKNETHTVRSLIQELVKMSDMDADVCFAVFNSDPIPVGTVEENTENQVILSN